MGFTFVDEPIATTSTVFSGNDPDALVTEAITTVNDALVNDASVNDTSVNDKKLQNKPTVFVGNVPLAVTTDKNLRKEFLKLFAPFGRILSFRFRSMALESKYKRAGFLNQKFNSDLKSTANAYIVYDDLDIKVLELNGKFWEDHHLRVDDSNNPKDLVPFRSVFLGNLPLDVTEEEIWDSFLEIGSVTNVRLVRDKISQVGKGFGFIEFSDKGSVSLALKKKFKIKDREIRVTSMKKNDLPAVKRIQKKSLGKNKKSLKSLTKTFLKGTKKSLKKK